MSNKITLHIIRFNEHCLEFLRVAQPAFAKVVAPWGHDTMKLAEAKRLSPNTQWICRLYRDEQPLYNPAYDAGQHAGLLTLYWDFYDVFESYNEPPPFGIEDWKRINEFEYQFARIVHEKGKKNVAFNWSNGQPPIEAWKYLIPAVKEADYIGIHSYGWPFLSTSEFALRHRPLYDAWDFGKPKIILTEFGFTNAVIGGPDVGYYMWDIHPWAAREYKCIQELAWFADRLQENPYVLAACYFTTGRLPGDNWGTHDWTPKIYRAMAGYNPQTQPKEEEPKMDVWGNAEKYRPDVAKFKKQIGDATRDYPVPIPDYKGIAASPAKTMAVIIAHEGNPANPNQVVEFDEKKDGKPTGRKLHAVGLCGIVAEHTGKTVEQLKDPYTNIIEGLKILQSKLKAANGVLRGAYYYYTGGSYWPSMEDWVNKIWFGKFVPTYKQFWGINLEPAAPPDWEAKYKELRSEVEEKIDILNDTIGEMDRTLTRMDEMITKVEDIKDELNEAIEE